MTKVSEGSLQDETGFTWEMGYYVKSISIDTAEGGDSLPVVYGIKIERVNQSQPIKQIISEETDGITDSYEEAEKWAILMAHGGVTPLHLHDAVDDLVG